MIISKHTYTNSLREYNFRRLPKWVEKAFENFHLVEVFRVEQKEGFIVIRGKEITPKQVPYSFYHYYDDKIRIQYELIYNGVSYGVCGKSEIVSLEEALNILPDAKIETTSDTRERKDMNTEEGEGEFGCLHTITEKHLVSSIGECFIDISSTIVPLGRKIISSSVEKKVLSTKRENYSFDNPWAHHGKGHGTIDLDTTEITRTIEFEDGEIKVEKFIHQDTLEDRLD